LEKPLCSYVAFFIFVIIICIMKKERIPTTPAIIELKTQAAVFTLHSYKYEEHGGTRIAAGYFGVDEHQIIKTLVMEEENGKPLIILMHGDKEVSTKSLARILGVKAIDPCKPDIAEQHTGYKVGGTSPFGTKKPLPIYMEKTIGDLPVVLINAGSRGILARMSPGEVMRILQPVVVSVAI
jgi:Cys-tRNA(Pro) deacylase